MEKTSKKESVTDLKKQINNQNVFDEPKFNISTGEGGFVFVSHSHQDIHEIRKIRNTLEGNGLEPICFYLRCLSDDNEVIDLIKREIDAREWFLLVDSENARKSRWVQTELEYIKSKNPRKIVEVSLDNREEIPAVLNRLSDSMRVFLSYTHKDLSIAKMIYDACLARDLKVFLDIGITAGTDFARDIENAICDASKHGCVVSLITKNSINSAEFIKEMNFAEDQESIILPIIVDDVELTNQFKYKLYNLQPYHLYTPVTENQISEIIGIIENLLLKRLHND